jgi:hypothetical protein
MIKRRFLVAAAMALALWTAVLPAEARQATKEMVPGITNLSRWGTEVACSGAIRPETMPEIKKTGFAGIYGTCQDQNVSNTKQFSAVRVYARCEAMRPDRCPGFYGFSVASDGKFKVGPAPNGSVIEGSVSADELTTLAAAVNAQLASGNKMTCLDIHTIPGSGRVIAAFFTDGSKVNLWTTGLILGSHGNCALGDYQKAQLVDQIIRKLMINYYPQTFPIQ